MGSKCCVSVWYLEDVGSMLLSSVFDSDTGVLCSNVFHYSQRQCVVREFLIKYPFSVEFTQSCGVMKANSVDIPLHTSTVTSIQAIN